MNRVVEVANPQLRLTFSGYQKFVIGVLAFLQFTIILDFMIISPLGAMMMLLCKSRHGSSVLRSRLTPSAPACLDFWRQGLPIVLTARSCYYFSMAVSCWVRCFVAWAPTYPMLLAARIVTGLFGGVIGSVALAIATDLFPLEMRGRVMGIISTAFAASQVLGLPQGYSSRVIGTGTHLSLSFLRWLCLQAWLFSFGCGRWWRIWL